MMIEVVCVQLPTYSYTRVMVAADGGSHATTTLILLIQVSELNGPCCSPVVRVKLPANERHRCELARRARESPSDLRLAEFFVCLIEKSK